MPQVSIFAAYSAGASIATSVEVPAAITANKIKALAGHEKTAYVFARLVPHEFDKKCPCFACDPPKPSPALKRDWYWQRAGWARAPRRLYVRFDIGQRNVRLNVSGGEFFVVVAECDVDYWLAVLPLNAERIGTRLALELALPLTAERATKKREKSNQDKRRNS